MIIHSVLNLFIRRNMTTGSVLECANNESIIYGSGFISENANIGEKNITGKGSSIVKAKPKKILSVRGPRTRTKLIQMGINCPEIYGDPLLLFPIVYNNPNITETPGKIGVIPYYADKDMSTTNELIKDLQSNNKVILIDIILPDHNYKKFIDEILECEYIISSSLHGMMMGLIYRKKTILIQFSNKLVGNLFKFYDFFESLDIKYNVKNDYSINILANVIDIDYKKLKNIVCKMIDAAPFIINKQVLKDKYDMFDTQ